MTEYERRTARLIATLWAGCALIAATGLTYAKSDAVTLASIEAEGTQFKVTLTDGRVLRSPELVGATLTVAVNGGGTRRMRIDALEIDPAASSHAPVFLHTLSVEVPGGAWENICQPGPDGRRQAFPLAGRARADATIQPAEQGAFEITCTGGAQGKCVRFGYAPWDALRGLPGFDLYNTCVRMVRADYAGDGLGTTRNGMLIDLYDRFGIQKSDDDPALEFEAGWAKDGAVCVRHVRVRDNVTLDALEQLSSLRGRTGAVCTEEFARAHGAVIFNRSRP